MVWIPEVFPQLILFSHGPTTKPQKTNLIGHVIWLPGIKKWIQICLPPLCNRREAQNMEKWVQTWAQAQTVPLPPLSLGCWLFHLCRTRDGYRGSFKHMLHGALGLLPGAPKRRRIKQKQPPHLCFSPQVAPLFLDLDKGIGTIVSLAEKFPWINK